jgi:tRNA(fMet)-specific endonuclease VapC
MPYLLDANTCIQHLRRRSSAITAKLDMLQATNIRLCSVVRAELISGALRSAQPVYNRALVEHYCGRFISLPFDDRAADVYADIRNHLATTGQLIGPNDLLIAAIAVANQCTLVTHNTREFGRVPGLVIEDWETPTAP